MSSHETFPDEMTKPQLEAPEQQGPPLRRMLFGPFGLRAVWGILLFQLILFTLAAPLHAGAISLIGQAMELLAPHHTNGAQGASQAAASELMPSLWIFNEIVLFGITALTTLVLSRIERRRLGVYGIGSYRLADVLPGAACGVVALSLLVGLLRAMHLLVFDGIAIHGLSVLRFGLEWLAMFFVVGLFEEYLMRGYMQFTLTRGLFRFAGRIAPGRQRAVAFWIAAVVMSLIFSFAHTSNGGENAMGLVMVFLAGMVFSYALWHTGSLWWSIGFHMAWDWAQSFLWGVPDSGGLCAGRLFHTHPAGNPLLSGAADGPEGSIFVIPVLLLVVFAIRMSKPGVQPPLEPQSAAPYEFTQPRVIS